MKVLERQGYGSAFNELMIHGDKITKRCKNEYGLSKIKNEIEFYKFLYENNIKFPMAKVSEFLEDGYVMEYLEGYEPLYKMKFCIHDVYESLDNLHNSIKREVSKDYFIEQLNLEIDHKIKSRYSLIKDKLSKYDYIKYVNDVKILPFYELLDMINTEILDIVNDMKKYYFVPIHGDCQFNNILSDGDDIVFIDPRGYFGESNIFGMRDYDLAKVLFAISGYDEFDSSKIDSLDIDHNNINIELNGLGDIFNRPKIQILLMLNIWLGNAHSFEKDEYKMVTSYFISLYLGSLYFSRR